MAASIMTSVGLVGFLAIMITYFILFKLESETHKELVDAWLLFKCEDCEYAYFIVAFVLILLIILQQVFYKREVKDNKIRIAALEGQIDTLLNPKKSKTK